ncbi:D-xylose 1-dehydrogenase (NADP(+)) [Bertholletia excelsa]
MQGISAINLAPNTCLWAIGSRSIEKASECASDNGFRPTVKVYGSYDAVLDDTNVDAVYVPLLTSLHLTWDVLTVEKKKHLEAIIKACESNGVHYMDATMWMHQPRTAQMRDFISHRRFGPPQSGILISRLFFFSGRLRADASRILEHHRRIFTYEASPEFLMNSIQVKPDLDALGALGNAGWYSIWAILWATDYELPKRVTALQKPEFNEAGCSFLTNLNLDIAALGAQGNLRVHDLSYHFKRTRPRSKWFLHPGSWNLPGIGPALGDHKVKMDLPQEGLMVREFARLVVGIKGSGSELEKKRPTISWKTQLVVHAVNASIERKFEPVELGN